MHALAGWGCRCADMPLLRWMPQLGRHCTRHLVIAEKMLGNIRVGQNESARGIHAGASKTCERKWPFQRHAVGRLDAYCNTSNIHPSAHVHPSAQLSPTAVVRAHAFIGARAIVSDGAVVGTKVKVGANTRIGAGVTLENCLVGDDCILHSGVRVGADGFGFYVDTDGMMVKKPQLLRVRIGDGVEVCRVL
eukprot:2871142-Pleurochrysis_carterae.AAC.5